MKYSKKEWLKALIHGFICGVAVVAFFWLLLNWFHDSGAEWLLSLGGAL